MRIFFVAEGPNLASWEANFIESISNLACVESVGLIVHGLQSGDRANHLKRTYKVATSDFFLRLLKMLERRKLAKDPFFSGCQNLVDISNLVSEIVVLSPNRCDRGTTFNLTEGDLSKVARSRIDLLIPLGAGILPEDFSALSAMGVVALQRGGGQYGNRSPGGFWEVMRQDSRSFFEIVHYRISTSLGSVMEAGSVSTQKYFLRNQIHMNQTGYARIKSLIEEIGLSGGMPLPIDNHSVDDDTHVFPTPVDIFRYIYNQLLRLTRRKVGSLPFLKSPEWRVSLVRESWQASAFTVGKEVKPALGTWIADPFLVWWKGHHYCFVEEFVRDEHKGRIAVYEITDSEPIYVGVALEEKYHLSFPFIFEHAGDLFLCPESHQANQIRLYRNSGGILDWELSVILIQDIKAVDTLIFFSKGRWTMLTSIDETGAGDYSAGLWCFQSDELLSTEWNKQGWKPANVSAVCMRNGGLLEYQEHTFRVGQVSDFGEYGSRVHINIIDTSESKYSEQLRDVVTPEPISGAIGLHHISGDNQITVFDYFSKK